MVFTQIGMKFTSDRGDFLVEMYILLSLVFWGHAEEDQKWETNEIINHLRPFYGLCLILYPEFDWL